MWVCVSVKESQCLMPGLVRECGLLKVKLRWVKAFQKAVTLLYWATREEKHTQTDRWAS